MVVACCKVLSIRPTYYSLQVSNLEISLLLSMCTKFLTQVRTCKVSRTCTFNRIISHQQHQIVLSCIRPMYLSFPMGCRENRCVCSEQRWHTRGSADASLRHTVRRSRLAGPEDPAVCASELKHCFGCRGFVCRIEGE